MENYRRFNVLRVGIDLLDVPFFPSGDWIKVNNPLIINLSSETYPRPDVWELVGYTPAGTINLGGDLTIESQDNAVIDSNSEIEISSVVTNNGNGFFALAIELIDRDYL